MIHGAAREVPDEDEDPHDHGHDPTATTGPRLAWLLSLPATALLLFPLFPPPALGSYSAAREDTQRAAQGVGTFPALAADDPVDLNVAHFSSRAIYDSGRSLKGRTVRLTGFVTHGDGGTWYVTRLPHGRPGESAARRPVRVRHRRHLRAQAVRTRSGRLRTPCRAANAATAPPGTDTDPADRQERGPVRLTPRTLACSAVPATTAGTRRSPGPAPEQPSL
ncbi:hypothetical protein ABZ656_11770 [Streptomyces sp. NPDC007095]|uniref:hypothetical protein n=1 Tax=Streptomyces sp. NPDC007095 TaxID=3154482 RepID=UPI0033FDA173